MLEVPPTIPAAEPPFDLFAPAVDAQTRRRLWLQVLLVLALAVLPDLYHSVMHLLAPDQRPFSWDRWAIYALGRSVQVSVTLLCVVALVGETRRSLGMQGPGLIDAPLSVVLYILTSAASTLLTGPVHDTLGYTSLEFIDDPHTRTQWAVLVAGDLANGFAEELAIWGFLYTRLRRLWHRSELASLAVAALSFAAYHVYQGADGMLMVLAFGVIHGVWFRLTKRLWPLIITHGVGNILNMLIW